MIKQIVNLKNTVKEKLNNILKNSIVHIVNLKEILEKLEIWNLKKKL